MSGQKGDFTAQAPLSPPAAYLSTDLVGSKSIYEIVFVPATTGTIKKIEMTFPAGTDISGVNILDRIGIGGGTLTKSGTTLTFTVNNAVSVPAGTFIRLEMVNVKNPQLPSPSYQVTVTTRDPANVVIDGSTPSTAYIVRQIAAGDIANGAISSDKIADNAVTSFKILDGAVTTPKINNDAVTTDKIATSFAYTRTLADGESGWNHNDSTISFPISDPLFDVTQQPVVVVNLDGDNVAPIATCAISNLTFESFVVSCTSAPPDGAQLRYAVFNAATP